MKKNIFFCIGFTLIFWSFFSFAEEALDDQLSDVGGPTEFNENADEAKIEKEPRYESQMRDLNRAYQAGALTEVEYINEKRHIEEMNK